MYINVGLVVCVCVCVCGNIDFRQNLVGKISTCPLF